MATFSRSLSNIYSYAMTADFFFSTGIVSLRSHQVEDNEIRVKMASLVQETLRPQSQNSPVHSGRSVSCVLGTYAVLLISAASYKGSNPDPRRTLCSLFYVLALSAA